MADDARVLLARGGRWFDFSHSRDCVVFGDFPGPSVQFNCHNWANITIFAAGLSDLIIGFKRFPPPALLGVKVAY